MTATIDGLRLQQGRLIAERHGAVAEGRHWMAPGYDQQIVALSWDIDRAIDRLDWEYREPARRSRP